MMNKLDRIFKDYGDGPLDELYFEFNLKLIQPQLQGKRVLELSTNLASTLRLAQVASEVVVVDGSAVKLDALQAQLLELAVGNVHCCHMDFFDFFRTNDDYFDEIILFRTLEHIEERPALLGAISNRMSSSSHLTISVPNALSLHRR